MKKRLLAMLLVLILCLTACNQNGNPPADPEDSATSYEDITPSKYIEIADEDYKGFELNLDIYNCTEVTLESQILSLLNEHKPSEPYRSEHGTFDPVISAGDDVYIYYRGYTLNDDGTRNYMDSMSNMNYSSPTKLTIGSGMFVPGFESELVGMTMSGYQSPYSDIIHENSSMLATISFISADEDEKVVRTKTEVLDMSKGEEYINRLGSGAKLYDALLYSETGTEIVLDSQLKMNGKNCKVHVQVHYTFSYDKEHYETIYIKFPAGYHAEDLSCKDAWFEVYPVCITEYYNDEAGEGVFDDEFVKDKVLGNNQKWIDALGAKYPTTPSLAEQYRLHLTELVKSEYQSSYTLTLETAILEYYMSVATVKKYPAGLLEAAEEKFTADLEEYVKNLESYYGMEIPDSYTPPSTSTGTGIIIGDANSGIKVEDTLKEYEGSFNIEDFVQITPIYMSKDYLAKQLFNQPDAENWQDAVSRAAKDYVKKTLIFYYILEKEGITLSEEILAEGFDLFVESYFGGYVEIYFYNQEDENINDYIGKESELYTKIEELIISDYEGEVGKELSIPSFIYDMVVRDFGITINTKD